MLFIASKLLQAITQPLFWLALLWVGALLWLGFARTAGQRRKALAVLWLSLMVLALLGFRAAPDALLRPLENRYPVPIAQQVAGHAGVVVLGGALQHPSLFADRGQVPLGESAERMTVPVGLLHQHPHLRLVFSGGEGRLLTTGTTEAELARAFYQQQGADMARITLEAQSRTTRENAHHVAQLLQAQGLCRQGQSWLLVTSAWHMPRSMAEFEPRLQALGCRITPYPVDYRTGHSTPLTEYSIAHSLVRWQTALHEWLGLAVYAATR
jgi:uncharacterized SAM-binding protein YcdF (DUF218 family)